MKRKCRHCLSETHLVDKVLLTLLDEDGFEKLVSLVVKNHTSMTGAQKKKFQKYLQKHIVIDGFNDPLNVPPARLIKSIIKSGDSIDFLVFMGRQQELSYRLWRGQMSLIMPLIERKRVDICAFFTNKYGASWPMEWLAPDDTQEVELLRKEPGSCQWGHLVSLIKNFPALNDEKQKLMGVVQNSLWVRNDLAHSRPVSLQMPAVMSRESQKPR